MDEQELKTLGRLPELCFLGLNLWCASPTIRNISDSDVCYFPKLRQLVLRRSMVLFVANKGDDGKKSVSFHIWDGKVDDLSEFSSVFQWEAGRGPVGEKSDEELQLMMCPLFLMKANVQQHLDSCQASKCFISMSVRKWRRH
jgi:hypothetical protein